MLPYEGEMIPEITIWPLEKNEESLNVMFAYGL